MQEDDLLLCTVEEIHGTNIFVILPNGKKGTISTSEIAPGRIKNIREYVVPNKKIVCKIIRVRGDNIELSLRRVTSKEKKEILEKYKQEQQIKSGMHQILKDKAEKIEGEILRNFESLSDFLNKAKEEQELIGKYIPKEFQEQLKRIIQKKKKEIQSIKILKLKCLQEDGITKIKKILSVKDKKIKIIYLSAGNFQIAVKAEDYKQANKNMEELLQKIEKSAKKNSCEFEIIEK